MRSLAPTMWQLTLLLLFAGIPGLRAFDSFHPGNGTGGGYIPVPVIERGHMEGGVNSSSSDGKTPLMRAVEAGDLEIIFYLLERGADPSMRDNQGKTALDLARNIKSQKIEQILLQHLALYPPATEYYANKQPKITVIGGQNQVGAPGGFLFHPLSIKVTDSGKPLRNAPVRFSANRTEGKFLTSYNSPASDWLVLRTDEEGVCRVYFALPKKTPAQRRMTAEVGSGEHTQKAFFIATADASKEENSPFDASDVQASMNNDMSTDISWTNHNDPDDISPIEIRFSNRNRKSVPLTTAPAGATSSHISP